MPNARPSLLRSLGPAFITASVVLGPGSIVTGTIVGAMFGFRMIWLLGVTTALMIGMTAISARLGVGLRNTPCAEVASRLGRPVAVLIGLTVFIVVGCFQSGNNIGIATALDPLLGEAGMEVGTWQLSGPQLVVIALNVLLVAFLFGFKSIYRWIERGMMTLVGLMLMAFAANLIFVLSVRLAGDATPAAASEVPEMALLPAVRQGQIMDAWGPVVALMGTTFSVAGAFFQAYLVRQKGAGVDDVRAGLVDTVAGIGVLNVITLVIMITSAAVLRGSDIRTAADIGAQLEPLFGRAAQAMFCLGLFAAALSSLLVNAAIGGSLLSDGLGLGAYLDEKWPKILTVAALAMGLAVALATEAQGFDPVPLIRLAQAVTVIAWPLLAGVLLWLARRPELVPDARPLPWMWALGSTAMAVALVLAPRTAYMLYLQWTIH